MFIKFMSSIYLNGIYNIISFDMEDLIKETTNETNYFSL